MIESYNDKNSGNKILFLAKNKERIKERINDILSFYCSPNRGSLSFQTLKEILSKKYGFQCIMVSGDEENDSIDIENRFVLLELFKRGGNCRRIITILEYNGWLDSSGIPTTRWSNLNRQSSLVYQWEEIIIAINNNPRSSVNTRLRIGEKSIQTLGIIISTIEKAQD